MITYNGIQIIVRDDWSTCESKLQIKAHVPVSFEMRKAMDAWLLETFGFKYHTYFVNDQDAMFGKGEYLIMHSHVFNQLKLPKLASV